MITIKLDKETLDKIKTIVLLEGIDEDELIEELRRELTEIAREKIDERYNRVIHHADKLEVTQEAR